MNVVIATFISFNLHHHLMMDEMTHRKPSRVFMAAATELFGDFAHVEISNRSKRIQPFFGCTAIIVSGTKCATYFCQRASYLAGMGWAIASQPFNSSYNNRVAEDSHPIIYK